MPGQHGEPNTELFSCEFLLRAPKHFHMGTYVYESRLGAKIPLNTQNRRGYVPKHSPQFLPFGANGFQPLAATALRLADGS